MIAVDNLDEVIKIIRGSENPKTAKAALMARFDLTDIQAQAILDMRLQRLTNLEILTLRKEYADVCKLIQELESILSSERKLMNVIKKELKAVADKYGDERRTEIADTENVVEAAQKEEAVAEEATVVFTKGGLLRRMYPARARKLMQDGEFNDDPPLYRFETLTDQNLYFFTNRGNCYQLSVSALPEMNKPKDRGSLLSGVLAGLEEDETPVIILCMKPSDLAAQPDLLFITAQGQVKRTAATEYDVRRAKFAAVNLKDGDEVHSILFMDPARDVLIFSESGMCIRFHSDSIPQQGRVAGGVKGMNLELGDRILWCGQPAATDQLLLFSDRGYGKRIPYMDFEPQARAGKGVKSFHFNKNGSNGSRLAAAALISNEGAHVRVYQKLSPYTPLESGEVLLQGKQDKGMPLVMALLDDIVTGMEIVEDNA